MSLCTQYFSHYFLFIPFSLTEKLPPFIREIQPEEMWLYKYHRVVRDHVPTTLMFVSIVCAVLVMVAFSSEQSFNITSNVFSDWLNSQLYA